MEEKRKHSRVTVILNASYLNTMVDVVDLSEEGMQIKSKVDIHATEHIQFFVFLNDLEMIKVTGEIVWKKPDKVSGYISGVKFKTNSEKEEETLAAFLKEARG